MMLGKANYPNLADVENAVKAVEGKLYYLEPKSLPQYNGQAVRDNLYVLGAIFGKTSVNIGINADEVREDIAERWPKAAETNLFAFQAGMSPAS